jgi:hypothetical protein
VLQIAAADPSVTQVVAMSRCNRFDATVNTAEEYAPYVASTRDPTIYFHVSGGAKVLKVVPGYRPEDTANLGHAVMIR